MRVKEIFVKKGTMEVFQDVPEKEEGKFFLCSKADQLASEFNKDELIKMMVGIKGRVAANDKKKSLKKLAFECFAAATENKLGKKAATPRKESKLAKLRVALIVGKTITKEKLSEIAGYDIANTHTAMSILKNPARTKDPIFYTYDKAKKAYTIFGSKKDMDTAIKTAKGK